MKTVVKRARAERDLEDCFVFLAEQDEEVGMRFLEAAEATFERLAQMPALGAARQFTNPALHGLRVWHVEGFDKYLIFYLVFEDVIDVVRVLHAARSIERALRDE